MYTFHNTRYCPSYVTKAIQTVIYNFYSTTVHQTKLATMHLSQCLLFNRLSICMVENKKEMVFLSGL